MIAEISFAVIVVVLAVGRASLIASLRAGQKSLRKENRDLLQRIERLEAIADGDIGDGELPMETPLLDSYGSSRRFAGGTISSTAIRS